MLKRFCLATCALVLLPVSCGGKSDEPDLGPASSNDGKGQSCQEICDAADECDNLDTDNCVEDCQSNTAVSRAGQEALTECLVKLDCEPDESDFAEALLCVPNRLDDLELSDTQRKYCEETVPAINECNGTEAVDSLLGSCEESIGLVSDELLAGYNQCGEEDCVQMSICLLQEIFKTVDLSTIGDLDLEGELSPALLSDLLALGVVVGSWGAGGEDLGFSLDGLLGDNPLGNDPNLGGSGNN